MRKIFTAALLCAAMIFGWSNADAQLVKESKKLSAFTAIEVGYEFDIVVTESETYKVEWAVDETVANLVKIGQQGSVLRIGFDSKAMTKEQKKHYKGKEAPKMTLKVMVYTPGLESITLADKARMSAQDATFQSNGFTLMMKDESSVSGLNIQSNNALIQTSGKAGVNITLDSKRIDVRGEKKSSVALKVKGCEQLNVNGDDDFILVVSGDVSKDIYVQSMSSSKTVLRKGSTPELVFSSKNSAELSSAEYDAKKVSLVMAGGQASVKALEDLKLELKGGSAVQFVGDPLIEIVRIEKSSVAPYSQNK